METKKSLFTGLSVSLILSAFAFDHIESANISGANILHNGYLAIIISCILTIALLLINITLVRNLKVSNSFFISLVILVTVLTIVTSINAIFGIVLLNFEGGNTFNGTFAISLLIGLLSLASYALILVKGTTPGITFKINKIDN